MSVGLTAEVTHQAQVLILKISVRRNSSVLEMHGRHVLQCPVNCHPATAMSSFLPAFFQCLIKNLLKPSKKPTPHLLPCRHHWFCLRFHLFCNVETILHAHQSLICPWLACLSLLISAEHYSFMPYLILISGSSCPYYVSFLRGKLHTEQTYCVHKPA